MDYRDIRKAAEIFTGHSEEETAVMRKTALARAALLLLTALSFTPANAEQYKFQTPMPSGVASPEKVETRLGTLNFLDGFPTRPRSRNYTTTSTSSGPYKPTLLAIPAVSQAANRNAIRTLGPVNTVVPIFEQLMELCARSSSPPTTTRFIAGHGSTSARGHLSSRCPRRCSVPSMTCGFAG